MNTIFVPNNGRMNYMNEDTISLLKECNSGCKMANKYNSASEESKNLAKRLVEMEQKFMNELLEYL
jgi:hypothetical protein